MKIALDENGKVFKIVKILGTTGGGGGGTGSGFNIDGGYANTVYIPSQLIDGGNASGS